MAGGAPVIGAAIIVLREVFEAVLVIGIVLAGTRGVARRGRWVVAGVTAGLLGAIAVAGSAARIASALAGVGQEIFNAGVLLAASLMLGWHNVWMKQHGADLARRMQAVGRDVTTATSPLSVLAVVVGLAVLREGSEVVLFLYGIAAGGTAAAPLAVGSLAGLAAGIAIGAAVYGGLVAIPTRLLFAVTGWLLLLLAAGMAAQAAGFLVQAGTLPALADPAWDSSALLPEHGLAGQVLHALVGYAERPSGMQLVFFLLVAVAVALLMRRRVGRPSAAPPRSAAAFAALALAAGALAVPRPAVAGLVVYSPIVEGGEVAVELRGARDRDASAWRNGAEEHKAEVEYAPTDYWLTEALATIGREPGGARELTELSWENVLQLTPQGKYWADVGLLVEYAHALRSAGHDAIELGVLAEKQVGASVVTANLTGEQALARGARAALGYALRWRWRLAERFEPGVELHGELGDWGRFGSLGAHRHQIGPAAKGLLRTAPRGALKWEAAWLFALTGASPDSTARLQLEYEF
jgi:FTR1 family protein